MNAERFVKEKLKQWARRKKISLHGSRYNNLKDIYEGESLYTQQLKDNLFLKKLSSSTKKEFLAGDGNELSGDPCKMQALHSSSLIAVNTFDYWRGKVNISLLAKSLKIPSKEIYGLEFEKKYPILKSLTRHPNIDVVINYSDGKCCAIECKFLEIFSSFKNKNAVDAKYLNQENLWDGIPNLLDCAKQNCPSNVMLNSTQLIKHILGLLEAYKRNKSKFRLVYLWYDTLGESGYIHRSEIEEFNKYCMMDGINFQNITWQELFINLSQISSPTHDKYYNYLCERYL